MDFSYLYKNGWQWRFKYVGQFTEDMLIPGEQFGIGGQDSIRGINERAFSNDRGYQTSLEIYTPDYGGRLADNLKLRGLVFRDIGKVRRNHPAVDESDGIQLSNIGLGIRASYKEKLHLRLDAAYIQNDREVLAHHSRIHGQLAWTF
jgi:hemolysin activation/secretion protein